MQPIDFLRAILPDDGVLCFAGMVEGSPPKHTFTSNVEDIVELAQENVQANKDCYFAISSFQQAGSRKASNASCIRTLAIDIDAYSDFQEAGKKLDDFLEASGLSTLGTPWVVRSGGGIHVYWAFEEHVDLAQWKAASENMRRLTKEHGLEIDQNVVGDLARVLRVPGTRNFKQKYASPRKVALVMMGHPARVAFTDFQSVIRQKLNGHAVENDVPKLDGMQLSIPGAPPKRTVGATALQLFKNQETSFKKLVSISAKGEGCDQIKEYLLHSGDDGWEPRFKAFASWAKFCNDGEEYIVKLGERHPYGSERSLKKLYESTNPYGCATVHKNGAAICEGCKHWGKVTNPLQIARIIPISHEPETAPPVAPNHQFITLRPNPPRGFGWGKNGGVYAEVKLSKGDKEVETVHVPVFAYDVWVESVVDDGTGRHMVELAARHPMQGELRFVVESKCITAKDEILKSLAERNIYPACSATDDHLVLKYMRAAVTEISMTKQPRLLPMHYGFQRGGDAFVLGGSLYKHGIASATPTLNTENLDTRTKPRGTLDEWRRVIQLLIAKQEWDILAIAAAGFGSVFMEFSQYNGFMFHVGATNSGTGKSVACKVAASIWGDPELYPISSESSLIAMQMRMGFLRNLPLVMEEMTTKFKTEPEFFPKFVLDVSRGQGKERAEAGNNKERVNNTTWKMIVIANSNTHQLDYLTASRKTHSEGELRRMLELIIEKKMQWSSEEKRQLSLINKNCGVAGPALVKWMTANMDVCQGLYDEALTFVRDVMGFSDDERFCEGAIAAIVAALNAACSKYAGVVDIPVIPVIESYRRMLDKQRQAVNKSVKSAQDILNGYIRENYHKFIIVRYVKNRLSTEVDGKPVEDGTPRGDVVGRIEHHDANDEVSLFIEETLMKAYCAAMCFGYAEFKRQLIAMPRFETTLTRKDLMAGTKGFTLKANCLRISAKHAALGLEKLKDDSEASEA